MPCPTVVFFGDSEELNATTYRQMSGRAGRRGFDKRGNVVFAGIPYHKVERLLNSRLPDLIGTSPADTAMFLRTLILHDVDSGFEKERDRDWVDQSKQEAIAGTKRLLEVRCLTSDVRAACACASRHSCCHCPPAGVLCGAPRPLRPQPAKGADALHL